jgi:hypothetical protein
MVSLSQSDELLDLFDPASKRSHDDHNHFEN